MAGASERGSRPGVDVVVPFAGTRSEADRIAARLSELSVGESDRLLLADNSPDGVAADLSRARLEVVPAAAERSSYYARNVGAESGSNAWILFLDADCSPPAGLLDDYLAEPVGDRVGIIAGEIVPLPGQTALAARYARSRGGEIVGYHLRTGPWPAGAGGNLLIRREAWDAVGGFHEGLRSGADAEICWRMQELGWTLEHRPRARVPHRYFETVGQLRARARRHGAGRRWVNRRYPGALPAPRLARPLLRAPAVAAYRLLRAEPTEALYKLLDLVSSLSFARGYWIGDNRAERAGGGREPGGDVVVIAAEFPVPGFREPPGAVEAAARPARIDRARARQTPVRWAEDDPPPARLRALLALSARHPLRAARDRLRRGRGEALLSLAPAAIRISRRGARMLVAADQSQAGERARRLGRLTGIEVARPGRISARGGPSSRSAPSRSAPRHR